MSSIQKSKIGYGNLTDVTSVIKNGLLDEYDIVFTSDTNEIIFISPDKKQIRVKARINYKDNSSALADAYEGQLVTVLDGNEYKPYIIQIFNDELILDPLPNKQSLSDIEKANKVTVESSSVEKTYTIKQGANTLATINMPKDIVSGTIEVNPIGYDKGIYLVLYLGNTDDKIYINVTPLRDIYTALSSAQQVQLFIDPVTKEISASIVQESIGNDELINESVTKSKLSLDLQDSVNKANTALQSSDISDLKSDISNIKLDLKDGGAISIKIEKAVNSLADGQVSNNEKNIAALEELLNLEISEEEINNLFVL